MVRISGINLSTGFGGSTLNTKRERIDNSEIYIDSKLSQLYYNAMANSVAECKLRSLKDFTKKGNVIDRSA